ncbi:phenylacetate--CoA ligase family protein [Alkalilimnicola sp. S0819]|uniref:phenylacetate--CoA ligase family protein n=1 Tax=Alkalilimnicola sp. S0819 TaxID=2613922 RepID=UPI0012621CD9|nr:phenylacetate--CoA ligase family protein [Alkalilimnicola sp. S0819]KAB7622862.1 phenylacetate--CoA ligase family protein [Alkalilimnicola sp. S0819]MPQ17184.1 AMP-binding protein [Alkalilimnicola sp. S0819]
MDIASTLVREAFFPLWAWWDGDGELPRHRHAYAQLDTQGPAQVREAQLQGLRSMLRHAHSNTPFYRERLDRCGLDPEQFSGLADLRRLPLLGKAEIRDAGDALIARNIPAADLLPASTGGSTGRPLRFYRDRQAVHRRKAQEWYFDRWMGHSLGEKAALFVAASHYQGAGGRLKGRLRNATCERLLRFDPARTDEPSMEAFARAYRRFRPAVIKCFPNALWVFAEFVRRRGIQLPPVRAISCTGENLYPHQRELFQELFGGEVFEKYGTKEAGVIACESAAHDGLYVFSPGVLVEVLREDGEPAAPGEMGRVVITDLFNRGMPLLRYDIGDMAVAGPLEPPAGGPPLPVLQRLLGRDRDILQDEAGRPRPGYLFVEVINRLNLGAQFQIIQSAPDRVRVKYVPDRDEPPELAPLAQAYRELLGPGVALEFQRVTALPRDPSGKYRYVVSEIPPRPRAA